MFRPNWIRPQFNGVNYERHVGKRTHVNLFFGVEGMITEPEPEPEPANPGPSPSPSPSPNPNPIANPNPKQA